MTTNRTVLVVKVVRLESELEAASLALRANQPSRAAEHVNLARKLAEQLRESI